VKLRTIFMMYLKARIWSWLTGQDTTSFAFTRSMQQIGLATFRNGKMMSAAPEIPDTPPPGTPGTMDGPPTAAPPTE
jgi:hypothetical protein